jgi:PAS domain S-box-containing protein
MNVLVIDDEESIRFTFENFLSEEGHCVKTASSYDEAAAVISRTSFDLIFSDILLGGKTGIDLLCLIRETDCEVPVVMITGYPTIETASDAVRLGAFDYIQKPVNQEMLLRVVRTASQYRILQREKKKYQSNLEAIFRSVKDSIITVDNGMNILEVNDSALGICGASRNSVGKNFSALLDCCSGTCLAALEETVREGKPVELHRVECARAGRQRQVVTLTVSPLVDDDGRRCGAVMVACDESRLDLLERNLRERKQFHTIIGGCDRMQQIYDLIEDLADVPSTVLISSESGTGKELVAEALHYKGKRSRMPLVKVNCSALSESLLESELFGHVKGAFTGAHKDKIGRFEKADGGTIFLDEIGDISHKMQLRLLRVLQEREFERVGDARPIKVDARVIAATNQDLTEKVRTGTFREDLYYRLNVVKLVIPPLRERLDDLPLLTEHFLKKFGIRFNKRFSSVSSEVERIFMEYPWPGNVRELEHTLEHACIVCRGHHITIEHLPCDFLKVTSTAPAPSMGEDTLSADAIFLALEKAGGNKAKAARILGVSRRTIYRRMEGR